MTPAATLLPESPPRSIVQTDNIPPELRERGQWVAWRWEVRNGKWTKPPVDPHSGGRASSTDAATWGTIQQALRFYAEHGWVAGIGFVFSKDDPYVGADLDKCRDPANGIIEPWARAIIRHLDSYTEVSPSARGVKVWLRASVIGAVKRGRLEIYETGPYFTMTGEHVEGTPFAVCPREGPASHTR